MAWHARLFAFILFGVINFFVGWRVLLLPVYNGYYTAPAVAQTATLVVLLLQALACLLKTACTDPGRVSRAPAADPEEDSILGDDGEEPEPLRHCGPCNNTKPPRCHHCRLCQRCVLKMDHHCGWLGRCIGLGNYKAYVLTLLYGFLASTFLLALMARRTLSFGTGDMGAGQLWGLLADSILLAGLWCGTGYLLCWHCFLMSTNTTTIEYYQALRDQAAGEGKRGQHQYNRGLLENLQAVLGINPLIWLLPTSPGNLGQSFNGPQERRRRKSMRDELAAPGEETEMVPMH